MFSGPVYKRINVSVHRRLWAGCCGLWAVRICKILDCASLFQSWITLIGGPCFQMKNMNFGGLHIRQRARPAGCTEVLSGGLFSSPPALLYVQLTGPPCCAACRFSLLCSPPKIHVIHLETRKCYPQSFIRLIESTLTMFFRTNSPCTIAVEICLNFLPHNISCGVSMIISKINHNEMCFVVFMTAAVHYLFLITKSKKSAQGLFHPCIA